MGGWVGVFEREKQGGSRIISPGEGETLGDRRSLMGGGNVLQVVQLAACGLCVDLEILLELLHVRLLH